MEGIRYSLLICTLVITTPITTLMSGRPMRC